MPKRILILTGEGKGKTTSAFGMALRALGRGWRVAVVQFIKHEGAAGEVLALRQFAKAEVICSGLGFTPKHAGSPQWARHEAAAKKGWQAARLLLRDPSVGMVVLDEVFYPVRFGMIDEEELAACLREMPEGKIAVLTGRQAPANLLEIADTASRIECVKHALQGGVTAQEGFEF